MPKKPKANPSRPKIDRTAFNFGANVRRGRGKRGRKGGGS
jgi:hypothetical protein